MLRKIIFPIIPATALVFAAVPGLAAGAGDFAGVWKSADGQYVLNVAADGSATLNGDFGPVQSERIKWTDCSANGTTLTCKWSGTYADELKDILRHGTVDATMDGSTLKGTLKVEKVDKEEWHGSPRYKSRATKDLAFSYTKS